MATTGSRAVRRPARPARRATTTLQQPEPEERQFPEPEPLEEKLERVRGTRKSNAKKWADTAEADEDLDPEAVSWAKEQGKLIQHSRARKAAEAVGEEPPPEPVLPPREKRVKGRHSTSEPTSRRVTENHDALLARKREAGAGRKEAPGTAFGSKWTEDERKELLGLVKASSVDAAVVTFGKAHPHRTKAGIEYQIQGMKKKGQLK